MVAVYEDVGGGGTLALQDGRNQDSVQGAYVGEFLRGRGHTA